LSGGYPHIHTVHKEKEKKKEKRLLLFSNYKILKTGLDNGVHLKDTEIQIKWQKHEARNLSIYHLNDTLEDLEDEFNNTWIRTDYICEVCSKKTKGSDSPYIKADDQLRHFAFVKIKDSKIEKILTEEAFKNEKVKDFVDYL
jgi:hypothetical protein